MGRCQGGFCMPLVAEIISETAGIPIEDVKKRGTDLSSVSDRQRRRSDEQL